jgi:hypothetical protein
MTAPMSRYRTDAKADAGLAVKQGRRSFRCRPCAVKRAGERRIPAQPAVALQCGDANQAVREWNMAKLRVTKSFVEKTFFGGSLSPVTVNDIYLMPDGYVVFDISGGSVPDTEWVSSVSSGAPDHKLSFIPD